MATLPTMSFCLLRAVLRHAQATALLLGLLLLTGCVSVHQRSFTFVQMCDPQLGFGGYEADVARFRQAVRQINQLKPDFVVICGDLVNGMKTNACAEFNALKAGFTMPCYCVAGNHDVGNQPTPKSLQRYREWQGKDYYAFEHKGFSFVVLDSQLWKSPVPGETEKQDAWLDTALALAKKKHEPIFIANHYPLFEKQPDEPDDYYNLPLETRGKLLAEFERNGVVAILAGHTHKTSAHEFHGIQMVTGEVTSRNFDKRPLGFRLWHIGPTRPYSNEFVPLEGQF